MQMPLSNYQEAYRKHRSAPHGVLRLTQDIQEAWKQNQTTVAVFADYEACFDRVWQEGLLYKLIRRGINGRMLCYLHCFLKDREASYKINSTTTTPQQSKVGIPQGAVLSTTLCNIYTADAYSDIPLNNFQYADDAAAWKTGQDVKAVKEEVEAGISKVMHNWCPLWNMKIQHNKTKAMIFPPPHANNPVTDDLKVNDKIIQVVKDFKLVGVTLDNQLNFDNHIKTTRTKAFKALKAVSKVTQSKKNPNQQAHILLYTTLVRPILDYAAECTVTATDKLDKAYSPIQRQALLTATGCLERTSTEALQAITGIPPIDIHLSCRQAQSYLRMTAKHTGNPIFDAITHSKSQEPATQTGSPLHLLHTRLNELKGEIEDGTVDKEPYCDARLPPFTMGNITGTFTAKTNTTVGKDRARQEILATLQDIATNTEPTTVIFTDGSALSNPGPTGCAAVIYERWGTTDPYAVRKPVAAKSNNYEGELEGLHLAIDTIIRRPTTANKLLLLCDCKAAIETVTGVQQVEAYNSLVHTIRNKLQQLKLQGLTIQFNWCPGHVGVTGNEIADKEAKLAANEARNNSNNTSWTKQQALKHIESQAKDRWNRRSNLNTRSEHMQKIGIHMKKKGRTLGRRTTQIIINQLVSGHTRLNAYQNWKNPEVPPHCPNCDALETTNHYLYHCPRYDNERHHMLLEADSIHETYNTAEENRDTDIVTLAGMREGLPEAANNQMYLTLSRYIESTHRFDVLS
ncbi:hypothetical protein Bbelb_400540 [Branchiostoma belcheri]|nr:hypothetical protein Bbelb_400540 [Branchiostoma belcheri]